MDKKLKKVIQTTQAPAAIGTYSQAIRVGDTVYISGQIPLVPETMEMIEGDFKAQTFQMFDNLKAVAEASGGTLSDVVKMNIYLTDMTQFPVVNEIMSRYFNAPYPARAALGVKELPRGALIEAEAIMVLGAHFSME
jgi:reactive intermediate/imine deaminase